MNKKELIVYSQAGKDKLNKLKTSLDNSIVNAKDFMYQIIRDLYIIKKEKLYFYDKCKTMDKFIEKNHYHKKAALTPGTIQQKIMLYYHKERLGITDRQYKQIPYHRFLKLFKKCDDKKKIIEISKLPDREYRKYIKQHPVTGEFVSKKEALFKQRKGTVIIKMWFEIPYKKRNEFEACVVGLCKQYDTRTL